MITKLSLAVKSLHIVCPIRMIVKLSPFPEWSNYIHVRVIVKIVPLVKVIAYCPHCQSDNKLSPLQKWSSSCTPCPSVHQIEPILKLLPLPEWSSCCPPCQSDQISSNSNDCQIGPLVKVIIKLSSGSEYPSNFTPFQWFPNWRYQFDSVPRARMITKLHPCQNDRKSVLISGWLSS